MTHIKSHPSFSPPGAKHEGANFTDDDFWHTNPVLIPLYSEIHD